MIIGIAGGTGSGKTTFTDRIKGEFSDLISVLYYDNYYKSQDDIPFEERKHTNYDHPDAFDTNLLIEHIKQLKNGNSIECPVYDYSAHTRSSMTKTVFPRKVIIVEGILTLQNKELRKMFDMKIFVETDADERIMRRAIRDVKERGRDIEGVFEQYLSTVKPMHSKYVQPTIKKADIVINGGQNEVAFKTVKAVIDNELKLL